MVKNDGVSLSNQWLDFGDLETKKFYFEDNIIPRGKRLNTNVHLSGYWLIFQGTCYFFRALANDGIINELLGEKVSEYFLLPTVHYELARGTVTEKEQDLVTGIASKWRREPQKKYALLFAYLQEHNYQSFQGLDFLHAIDYLFLQEPIQRQIRSFLVRDFFSNEFDRMSNEILVSTGKEVELGYLTDYEYEFFEPIYNAIAVKQFYNLSLENEALICQIKKDEILMEEFRKSIQMDLMGLLEEVKQEKKLRLGSLKEQRIKNFEQNQKRRIKRALSL